MSRPDPKKSWIITDVGATNSRCALIAPPSFEPTDIRYYRNREADSLQDILQAYITEVNARPVNCAIAVAAPVFGDDIQMCNHEWRFTRDEIGRHLGVRRTEIINDFHAIACALPELDETRRVEIGRATQYRQGNIAALGPGSGLGVSAWIDDGTGGSAMSGEGGHITLSSRNENEDAIIARLRQRFGHCSAERVLSGPGLIALHKAMHNIDVPTSEEITTNPADPLCAATLNQFFSFLGSAAADLALITGAFGGIYIAGGIVPKCTEQIRDSDFRARFDDKNRYRDYMRAIPTWVITDPTPGLTGLSVFVRRQS